MQHQYKTPQTCACDRDYCPVCLGGLHICMVCGCVEGSLPTECPGSECWSSHGERIYDGLIDYRNGEWVEDVPSIHSPEGIKRLSS